MRQCNFCLIDPVVGLELSGTIYFVFYQQKYFSGGIFTKKYRKDREKKNRRGRERQRQRQREREREREKERERKRDREIGDKDRLKDRQR